MNIFSRLTGDRNRGRKADRNRRRPSLESMESKQLLSAASVTMLTPGQSIPSVSRQYRLLLDTNGDLAEYNAAGKQLWHSGTAGNTAVELDLRDGNLLLVGTGSRQLWASNSGGHPGAFLNVQDDGDVVIDDGGGNMIWHTDTAQSPTVAVPPAGQGPGGGPTSSAWPAHAFAPFVDVTDGSLSSASSLTTLAADTGTEYFSLGFITPDANGNPVWGNSGYGLDSAYGKQVAAAVKALQAQGGDVVVSFGGQGATAGVRDAKQDLAEVATSAAALEQDYLNVIDAYGVTHLDFDVEGAALAATNPHTGTDAVELRSQALAMLGRDRPGLTVSFTLPVEVNGLQTGAGYNALHVLQSAVANGVAFSTVNLMTMDFNQALFASGYSQDGAGNDMAYYTEQAATAVAGQLRGLEPGLTSQQAYAMIGLIPEVGANDGVDANEVFDAANATQLETWAQNNGIGRLSMWSTQRDGWFYNYQISQAFSPFGRR